MKRNENIVAKGQIARSEQRLLLSQCFQIRLQQKRKKVSICRERVNDAVHF